MGRTRPPGGLRAQSTLGRGFLVPTGGATPIRAAPPPASTGSAQRSVPSVDAGCEHAAHKAGSGAAWPPLVGVVAVVHHRHVPGTYPAELADQFGATSRRCKRRVPSALLRHVASALERAVGERGGHPPVGGGLPRTRDRAAQHRELVPQWRSRRDMCRQEPDRAQAREQPANEDEGDRGPTSMIVAGLRHRCSAPQSCA